MRLTWKGNIMWNQFIEDWLNGGNSAEKNDVKENEPNQQDSRDQNEK